MASDTPLMIRNRESICNPARRSRYQLRPIKRQLAMRTNAHRRKDRHTRQPDQQPLPNINTSYRTMNALSRQVIGSSPIAGANAQVRCSIGALAGVRDYRFEPLYLDWSVPPLGPAMPSTRHEGQPRTTKVIGVFVSPIRDPRRLKRKLRRRPSVRAVTQIMSTPTGTVRQTSRTDIYILARRPQVVLRHP